MNIFLHFLCLPILQNLYFLIFFLILLLWEMLYWPPVSGVHGMWTFCFMTPPLWAFGQQERDRSKLLFFNFVKDLPGDTTSLPTLQDRLPAVKETAPDPLTATRPVGGWTVAVAGMESMESLADTSFNPHGGANSTHAAFFFFLIDARCLLPTTSQRNYGL